MSATTVDEPEWTTTDVDQLLAVEAIKRNRNSQGIDLDVATDPANQFAFVADESPTVDWAAKALADRQDAYYAQFDRPGEPVSRAGHMWSVRLDESKRREQPPPP